MADVALKPKSDAGHLSARNGWDQFVASRPGVAEPRRSQELPPDPHKRYFDQYASLIKANFPLIPATIGEQNFRGLVECFVKTGLHRGSKECGTCKRFVKFLSEHEAAARFF